jgi:hypothetical protein
VLPVWPAPAVEVPPPRYTGAFYAVEAAGGLARLEEDHAPAFDIGLRASSVLQMADVAARYELSTVADEAQHRLMFSAQLHPFFIFLLGSDRLFTTLASVYVRLGLGGGWLSGGPGGAVLWDWGAGLDTPLTEPDAGSSLWLGAEYRRTSTLDDESIGAPPLQSFVLRLGYRFNVF